jgi:hypothetical protein
MNSIISKAFTAITLAFGVCCCLSLNAQVQTQTSTQAGVPITEISVEKGEVVSVNGNDLVVKMADGSLRHIANVAESARVTVDGQQLGIHDLKPGMKLQRTISVTTTPQTITTVQSVTGTVWHVNPPRSVILTMENGENQQFKIPQGQKFNVEGQMVDAWGLKKGMKVSATKFVEVPQTVVDRQAKVTGTMPPAPAAPAADQPILIAESTPAPAPAAEPAPTHLPKTGSAVPFIGLAGLLCMCSALAIRTLLRS